jgi:zinc protease
MAQLVYAQKFRDLSQKVPFDKEIRQGVLPNGLTYYIRANKEPENRAYFYIYQNVGAILENDKQDGLAHFLEHMAFNGTKTFPGNSMLDMLERNGIKFGRDVNAYTAHNETVYNISRVPTTNKPLLDSCLMILHDWCDALALTKEEIDAERGVISEEWRTRRNAGFRVRGKMGPAIYNNSAYAYRDIIGELDVIKNFDPEEIRSFYHDWYRTDLQAISIVGDIDAEEMEKKVIKMFSKIPAIENPKKRGQVIIPDHKESLYTLATDRELQSVGISLIVRHKTEAKNTLESLRQNYVHRMFNSLMRGRFGEISQKGDAPFLSASASYTNFVRGYNTFTVAAKARKDKQTEAFEAVYTEVQRVLNHGFTQSELDRLKTNMLLSAEKNYKLRDKNHSESYCKSLKSAYMKQISLPDEEFTYQFAKEIIPGIGVEEVSAVAREYLIDMNRVYTVTGPENTDVNYLTKGDIEYLIEKVEKKDIEPYKDNVTELGLSLLTTPRGGKIVSEKKLKAFDAVEWTLSNGARVVYRFADYEKQTVALQAISKGGFSLYNKEDLASIGALLSFMPGFGIGKYDPVSYSKVMTGKSAGSNLSLNSLSEAVLGRSTPEDVESMMKLVYMRFEEPRFDREVFDNMLKRYRTSLKQKVETPTSIMQDTLKAILANGDPRSTKFDENYLDQMDFERMTEIYHERFSNAADYTFFIVGNIDAETLKPLVEKYLASIGSSGSKEEWKFHPDYFPKGKNEHRIAIKMAEPKAGVMIKLKADAKYTRERAIYHTILKSILTIRFTKNIREKEGGTYGVGVKANMSLKPKPKLSMDIGFDCDPDKADYLKSLVYKELDKIQKSVSKSDLDKVVSNMKKSTEKRTESNGFWLNALKTWYERGENIVGPEYLEDILDEVTTKDIRKAAKDFFKRADVLDVVFVPEGN